jgi:hypothetical protein
MYNKPEDKPHLYKAISSSEDLDLEYRYAVPAMINKTENTRIVYVEVLSI